MHQSHQSDSHLLHHLITHNLPARATRSALTVQGAALDYAALAAMVGQFASAVLTLGLERQERVGVFLAKGSEFVAACFGSAAAGAVFVPVNPLLKAAQAAYILRDCNVRILVTSAIRLRQLQPLLADCPDLRHVIVVDGADGELAPGQPVHGWADLMAGPARAPHRVIDTDMAAIFYTSGSTGKPKGVVLSHRNMVCGAKSVAGYLGNDQEDVLLAALPLSFDAGFSQLTTGFFSGARVVLLNYVAPREVLAVMLAEGVTGLTGVPPLWMQLAALDWPAGLALRYFANTGGKMPGPILAALRARMPAAEPYLMYGLTEAFRSTYLPPAQVDLRPGSIGKAIPNAEILVLDDAGHPCAPGQPGELVHRGALVSLGYWNDPQKTAERFKPLPRQAGGLVLPELAVFSGDTVRCDEDGYLYFIGRRDDMIKTSGYRVSPTEVEEVLYALAAVAEAAAFGVEDEQLGQSVAVVLWLKPGEHAGAAEVLAHCRRVLPPYMVPARLLFADAPLPRNQNGKIDRKLLAENALAREECA